MKQVTRDTRIINSSQSSQENVQWTKDELTKAYTEAVNQYGKNSFPYRLLFIPIFD
ncbi:MAG: hypothetical protein KJ556_21040 [Gammaproteobacteria bacterium]|nr:hypothetical protein [Gammaproteobacteria bacterium]